MVEDINQNRNDFRHEPTSLVGATTSTRLHKGQPMQILEHNGQLFVALQEDYPLQNKLSKQVYKDGHYKNIAPRDLPSAIIACTLIQEHFIKNKLSINGFSVAVFISHRLKLGVNNMEDYSKLVLSDKWLLSINGKKASIIKPKFVLECFTLVLRYISKSFSIQIVSDEIK
ncbi:unnamed protein product [Rotaria sp. Silwood1]|nr:unnamed protein product [Rotaria sp. Silwood1]CAF4926151.1 unnamed protein product [Rotaria sp. Silwood1]